MDTNEEERAKGKTVEVGRAHFESATKRYTTLDALARTRNLPLNPTLTPTPIPTLILT